MRGKRNSSDRAGRLTIGAILLGVLLSLTTTGCGAEAGGWMYTLGLYPKQKIPAEFTLPKGNVLILVDDNEDLINPSTAREALIDELAKQLSEHKITDRVTTNEELTRIRQNEPRFDERGAREIGELANAKTVIWINTIEFSLNNNLEMIIAPAKFSVMVRVLNVEAENRDKVRLWPETGDGRLVEAAVGPHALRASKSLNEAHQKMAAALAVEIANLFYERQVEE